MVLDSGVKGKGSMGKTLRTAVERALTLETWVSSSHEGATSQSFIRHHTQFDSVREFCEACPCEDDTIGGVQRLSADERDAFVARTTDFESWEAMRETAAVEDLLTLQNC